MGLPKPSQLRAIFAACKDNGVRRLSVAGLEIEMLGASELPVQPGAKGDAKPSVMSEDPIAVIRRELARETRGEKIDPIEALGAGIRFVEAEQPDPTAKQ